MYTTDTRMPTAVRRHPPVVDKAAETTAWCGLVWRGLVRRGPVQRTTTLPTLHEPPAVRCISGGDPTAKLLRRSKRLVPVPHKPLSVYMYAL